MIQAPQPSRRGRIRATLTDALPDMAEQAGDSRLIREIVTESLRRAIELGLLRAGERLVEKDLCDRFGVSRPSLREALRDLEAKGVVSKIGARTLIITPLTREDLLRMTSVRARIEAMLGEHFCLLAGDADIAALDEAMEAIRNAGTGMPSLEANNAFYRAWCRGADNDYAFGLLMNLQLRLAVVRSESARLPGMAVRKRRAQEQVVAALKRRDIGSALDAIARHNRLAALVLLQTFPADGVDPRDPRRGHMTQDIEEGEAE